MKKVKICTLSPSTVTLISTRLQNLREGGWNKTEFKCCGSIGGEIKIVFDSGSHGPHCNKDVTFDPFPPDLVRRSLAVALQIVLERGDFVPARDYGSQKTEPYDLGVEIDEEVMLTNSTWGGHVAIFAKQTPQHSFGTRKRAYDVSGETGLAQVAAS